MILRFLRRSSLNGDSWSIAISSRLQEDSSFLSHAKGKTAGGGSGGSRCASRAEAARPRRRDGTGGRRKCGQASEAKRRGNGLGDWGYICTRARTLPPLDGESEEESQRVAVCYCWRRRGRGKEGGCGRNGREVAVLIPSPPGHLLGQVSSRPRPAPSQATGPHRKSSCLHCPRIK
jgi:hypothetical protein